MGKVSRIKWGIMCHYLLYPAVSSMNTELDKQRRERMEEYSIVDEISLPHIEYRVLELPIIAEFGRR